MENLLNIACPQDKQQRLAELVRFVRASSPFYREFYRELAPEVCQISELPILDSQQFWQANTVANNRVLTAPFTDGLTFKSGGTTGQPKYSVFTNQEWRDFTANFGAGMRRSGLAPASRIGNLFYAGKLYASFLFITRSIEAAGAGICYPIAGDDLEEILATWRQFDLDVLAGVPTTLMKLLESLSPQDRKTLQLRSFLYGGEPIFADQIALIQEYFPACEVRSIGIAGVDYGELGWASSGAEPGVHHCFDASTITEIVNDAGQAINETGLPGKILLTNLQRRLMPIIRYPVGDQGIWLDPPGSAWRRFRLLGRTEEGARIGPMTLYIEDIRQALAATPELAGALALRDFQLLISHHEQRDACTLRLAVADPLAATTSAAAAIKSAIARARPMYADLLAQGLVHELRVEWLRQSELQTNPRTGKIIRVLDQRHG